MIPPFAITVDTREQAPFTFGGLLADARQGRQPIEVATVRRGLPSGDYSLEGFESQIAIERKSLSDLFHSLGHDRGRFKREIARLAVMRFAAVVVEADWSAILNSPPEYTRFSPKIVFRTVLAWQLQFPAVHWWMCTGRRLAEITTFRLLERFWKMNDLSKKKPADGLDPSTGSLSKELQ